MGTFWKLCILLGACLLAVAAAFAVEQKPDEAQSRTPAKAEPAGAEPLKPVEDLAKSAPAPVDPRSYQLGAEDVVLVRVWREPELSGQMVVRPDGQVSMPLIGDLKATGLTPLQLAEQITEKLSKYIHEPEVNVSVLAVRSKRYSVTGEVSRPGVYPLVVATTVLDALTQAGGFREFANTKNITVLRGSKRFKFNYKEVIKGKNMSQNILLENGDYVVVP
jgi:polysaccharide export outer membrane protein